MLRRYFVLFTLPLLSACASTQQMHFADFSLVDYRISSPAQVLGVSGDLYIASVSGGDYTQVGEFKDYSWHGMVSGQYAEVPYKGRFEVKSGAFSLPAVNYAYESFGKLPYRDPSFEVKSWVSDLLEKNGMFAATPSGYALQIYVTRLKEQSVKSDTIFSKHDYRACLVELKLTVRDALNAIVRETIVEGLAKLPGSDLEIIGRRFGGGLPGDDQLWVEFSPNKPPVCELAIANALRGKGR